MNYAQILKEIIQTAFIALSKLEEASVNQKPSPTKWSKKELLGHLIDSAYNNHQRFLRAEAQDNLIFQGYQQDEWVRLNNYQQRPFIEILELWKATNLHLVHVIEQIPLETIEYQTTNHNFHIIGMNRPEKGAESSLGYLIWDYIFHLEHHLHQLLTNYEKLLPPFDLQ